MNRLVRTLLEFRVDADATGSEMTSLLRHLNGKKNEYVEVLEKHGIDASLISYSKQYDYRSGDTVYVLEVTFKNEEDYAMSKLIFD